MKPFSGPLLLGLLLAASVRCSAQHAPAPIEREPPQNGKSVYRVESRLVPVAVNVVDANGAPVGGLEQADFEISEDGKPQKIAVFDREAGTPLSLVMAFDASESTLQDTRLLHEAARKFIRALLRPQDEMALFSFADTVDEIVPFTNNAEKLESGLGRAARGEATAMYDALYLASERLLDAPAGGGRRRVVVILSDGENTVRHGTYDAALEEAQRAGAMLYALIDVPVQADPGRNTGGEHALIQLAEDTGGKYFYISDKRDLAPAFQHISDDLRSQYTIGYYAPQRGGDSAGLRHIQLRLKDPAMRAKYTLRNRTAYFGARAVTDNSDQFPQPGP